MLDIIKPTAEIINKTHPIKLRVLLDIYNIYFVSKYVAIESSMASNHVV